MMKTLPVMVHVLQNFFDLEKDKMSIHGEEYEVSRKRGEHLEGLKLVELLE